MIYWVVFLLTIIIINSAGRFFNVEKKRLLIFTCVAMILFQRLRSVNVGVDLVVYQKVYHDCFLNSFNELQNIGKSISMEMGYLVFCKISSIIFNDNWQLYLLLISIICNVSFFVLINDCVDDIFSATILYLCLGNFVFTFSALRQSIAIAICMIAVLFLLKDKPMIFLFCVLFATTFHMSAIVFASVIIFKYIRFNKTLFVVIILLYVVIVLFSNQLFRVVVENFIPKYVNYISGNNEFGYFSLFLLLGYIYICLSSPHVKNGGTSLILLLGAAGVLCQAFGNASTVTSRITFYFLPYMAVLIGSIDQYSLGDIKNKKIKYIRTLFLLLTCYVLYRDLQAGYLNITPYEFFWEVV